MKRRNFLKLLQLSGLIFSIPGVALAVRQKQNTGLVYDDLFLQHWLQIGHPESPARLRSIMQQLQDSGLLESLVRIQPKKDILAALLQVHTQAHLDQLQAKYVTSNKVALATIGGILAATDAVCSGQLKNVFCATRPPGHHARNSGRVEGFCFYNGVAVAARYAQQRHHLEKILIIDWDYHYGDGSADFFYTDPSVLFFSTHDRYAYPGTGDPDRIGEGAGRGTTINVHLDCAASDSDIITAFNEKLLPAANSFKPDLIIISAGFDSRKDDPLGCFDITDLGYRELTRIAMQLAQRHCHGRIISVLEGGYNPQDLAGAVKIHIETLMEQ